MIQDNILKIVQKIADDFKALCLLVLETDTISNNTKIGRNTLKDSQLYKDLYVKVESVNNPVITAFFNNYVVYLEWDRPPKYKKRPPISVLVAWASKNGIPTDNKTLWKISTAIWRDGHKGRPIFATIGRELDKEFAGYADEIFEAITKELDTIFSN